MKKFVLTAALLCIGALLFAEGELGMSLYTEADAGFVGKSLGSNALADNAAYYDLGFTAGITYTFGIVSLTPWVGDEVELGFDPDGTDSLGTIGLINYAYIGLDSGFGISDAVAPYLNVLFEFDTGMAEADGVTDPKICFVITPTIGVGGSIGGFFYDISEDFLIQITDETLDIEGEYDFGYDFESFGLELYDEFIVKFGSFDISDDQKISSDMALTASLYVTDFTPFIGAIWYIGSASGALENNVIGFTVGAGFEKDNWAVSFAYEGGQDLETEDFVSDLCITMELGF